MSCLVLFKSITYAQRGVKVLERYGISTSLIRKPAQIKANGCGYAALIDCKKLIVAIGLLNDHSIPNSGAWSKYKGEWVILD